MCCLRLRDCHLVILECIPSVKERTQSHGDLPCEEGNQKRVLRTIMGEQEQSGEGVFLRVALIMDQGTLALEKRGLKGSTHVFTDGIRPRG